MYTLKLYKDNMTGKHVYMLYKDGKSTEVVINHVDGEGYQVFADRNTYSTIQDAGRRAIALYEGR